MRVIAYKMITHARMVGYIRFIDGNKLNYNKNNLERVDFNHVLNDILDKKDSTNWDIVLSEPERKYIKTNSNDFSNFIYDKFN
jgi:hypothetical protein